MRGRKLTLDEKLRIIKEVEKGRSKTKVGREYNLNYQAVHKIWLKREQIAKKLDKEFSKPVEAAVDEELIAWYREENPDDLSHKVLFNKAEELMDLFGSKFDDATEWVEEFKLRHGIFFEAGESDSESDCESDSEKNPDNDATCEDTEYSSDEEESLVCLECDVGFTSKYYLYNHLLHHVKQPAVTLRRIDVPAQPALNPIRIVFKCRENSFEIISSPQASPKIADLKETADRADITGSLEDDPLATGGMATIEEIENETELDTNVTFSPNYIGTDNIEKEDAEMDTSNEKPEYNNIPGAEPTPPPEPSPEYPKIRIKSGLLKEPLTITEITDDNPNGEYNNQSTEYQNLDNYGNWATPSLEDPLRLPDAGENDSSLLSNLFTNNNDRAKDLGFTTSDTEFISLDSNRSSGSGSTALQVYNSSANSMISSNPLDTLTNLPMQQLAQQVSRLQPNGSNGMHQQNVLINIQQFPQAPPPQQHTYQPHMYPPHPPQPMYHQPYQPYQ